MNAGSQSNYLHSHLLGEDQTTSRIVPSNGIVATTKFRKHKKFLDVKLCGLKETAKILINVLPLSSKQNMEPVCFSETPGNALHTKQHHTTERTVCFTAES